MKESKEQDEIKFIPPSTVEAISKEVFESYIFVTGRSDLGMYGERLLLRLVEIAQSHISGVKVSLLPKIDVDGFGNAMIEMPTRYVLSGKNDTNYTLARKAIKNLEGKTIEFEDSENRFKFATLINSAEVDKVSGKMRIEVNKSIWASMLDFSRGFRKYEIQTALKIKGPYALRLYKLMSKQSKPYTILIEDLKKMWKIEDMATCALVRRKGGPISNAKKELDAISPYSFDWTVNKGSVNGRSAVKSITFYPLHILRNELHDRENKSVSISLTLGSDLVSTLIKEFGFTYDGIKANITLFEYAAKNLDIMNELKDFKKKALESDKPQAYIIGALRKRLDDECGIRFKDGMFIQMDEDEEPNVVISKDFKAVLTNIYGFTKTEMENNKSILEEAQNRIQDIIFFITQLAPKATRSPKPKGYVISSIKKKLKQLDKLNQTNDATLFDDSEMAGPVHERDNCSEYTASHNAKLNQLKSAQKKDEAQTIGAIMDSLMQGFDFVR